MDYDKKVRAVQHLFVGVAGARAGHRLPFVWQKKKDGEKAYVDFHQEATGTASDTEMSPFSAQHPIFVTVDKESFLDSGDVTDAKVLEDLGGFVIQLRFNWRGQQILDGVTTANRRRRIAIHCLFNNGKEKESRWLASPVINSPISNGILTFTPDTTRAEANLIAKGINWKPPN